MSTALANARPRSTYQLAFGWALIPPALVALVGPMLSPVLTAWLAAVAIYAMFKIWTLQSYASATPIPVASAIGYLFFWPGMDPSVFVTRQAPVEQPALRDWLWGIGKTLGGVTLLWVITPRLAGHHPLLVGWIGLVGIAFVLHFGVLHLLALAWRAAGVAVEPLMRAPILASSLSDFWSHRWNLAFRDLAQVFFFRPFVSHVGAGGAMMVVFALSGLIHDLVISLPSGAGYGLPSLYFIGQGIAVLVEKSRVGRRWGLGRGNRGRLFAWLVVVPGAFWLFHPPFMRAVVLPTLSAIGAR